MSGPVLPLILDGPEELARHAAHSLVRCAERAAAAGRRARIALAGGSTPRRLYELLADEFRDRIDWRLVEVFFGDERCVPPDHGDSNFRMARESLLDHVPVPPERVHRMPAEEDDLEAAARRYADRMRDRLPLAADGFPVIDLIWLGLGEDGHTASLFPGTRALDEERAWVVGNEVPQLGTRRMTLTLPVLNRARRVQFIVSGAGKSEAVAGVFRILAADAPEDTPAPLPAARVRPVDGLLEWLLDREAARALE